MLEIFHHYLMASTVNFTDKIDKCASVGTHGDPKGKERVS